MRQLKITKSITNRESQSLEKYLQEIGKVDLLTPEEEVDLAKRIKQGDQAALEKLTKANLRFVVSVAKQYQNQGLSLSDLINEGNLGLIKAAQRFDETRGFKFISYAVWWIRQSILQALAEQSRIVRLPLNKVGSLNKINKAFSELEQEYEKLQLKKWRLPWVWLLATCLWMRLSWMVKTIHCWTFWKIQQLRELIRLLNI
jgi:RNA polymerase primary sigma factor